MVGISFVLRPLNTNGIRIKRKEDEKIKESVVLGESFLWRKDFYQSLMTKKTATPAAPKTTIEVRRAMIRFQRTNCSKCVQSVKAASKADD